MNKNTKRVLSVITVASLSVTSFTGNIQNVVNAKEDKQEENVLLTNRVNAEVLENEAGAVIRVSASSNVQNVKTTYSVDTAGSKVVSFGNLKAGEVREIQVNFEEDSNKLKSLPKTTAVSDRVDFNKEVRGHKIKGSVSFEYDNGDTAPTAPITPTNPVVTPTVPTTPTNPVVTTPSNPTTPTNPVVTPTEPTTPINPNAKKVNLDVNVHVTLNGQPRVFTVGIYRDVEVGTKVTLEHVKEVLKEYNFVADKLEGFPAVLDKDYAIDVDVKTINTVVPTRPMIPLNPTKPVTPAKPLQPVIPDTPDEPVVTPEKPGRPVAPVVTPTVPTTPTKPGLVKPLDPNNPVKPSFPAGEVQKVDLNIMVHVIEDGVAKVLRFRAYAYEEVGTKVDPEYVKGVIRSYGYEIVKIGKLPEVLDKTYTVDADAKPVTPAVTPADTGLEAGMPANVKWSRAQLKEWGFTFGKITGNYDVDGDLGVFDNDDTLDPAYRSGRAHMLDDVTNGKMDFNDFQKNTPHGYAWHLVTKPDGTDGYAMYLYGTDGKFNDGQKAR
ncbi:hypothetical protein [Gemella haemolysans]|uniref:hypothetical protein n=1 Tax=Gemella haemolysans TaxID=1379 RepID=UPI002378F3A7|nr:hypothetical protein [Gemella haemolysans]